MQQSDFLRRLGALAELSRTNLSQELIGLYDKTLSRHGYDVACEALEDALKRRRGRDAMPSIAELEELCGKRVSEEHTAIEVANRIIQAIADRGYSNPEAARAFVGEIGWLAVERNGGWLAICENTMADMIPATRAQLRELVRSLLSLHRANKLVEPPKFEKLPGRVKELTKSIGGTDGRTNRRDE